MKKLGSDRVARFIAHPGKALWILSAPMMAGFSAHALYSVVDTIFIGKLGPQALAAAGYIGSLFFTAIALTNGLSTGITAHVAKSFGARDHETLNKLAHNGFWFSSAVGVVFCGIGVLLGPQIIPLLGAKGESASLAWDYMLPLWSGLPLFFISTSIRSVINGEGDAKTPMMILSMATLLNLVLDPVFIFVFDMGITGASVATVVAQSFALLALVYIAFVKKRMTARFHLRGIHLERKFIGAIVSIGFPAAAGHLVMALGMVLMFRVVAHFGQTAVAGYVAGNRIDMIVALPLLGIASAAMTLTGIFCGAKRPDLVRKTTFNAYLWSLFSSLVMGGSAFLFSGMLIGLFSEDANALAVGTHYLAYAVFAYPLTAVGMTTGRILQGLGLGWPSLVITTIRVLVVGVTGAYVAVYVFNTSITGIWISLIVGGGAAAILSIFWVRKKMWVKGDLATNEY